MTIGHQADELQIRDLIEHWAAAIRGKDVGAVMIAYAPGFLAFDIAPPLRSGVEGYRGGLEQWFLSFRGSIGYEMRDLVITAGEDVAFSHSLNHLTGGRTNGEETDVWMRATFGFRRFDGRWKITHEHVSVPLYMDGSGRAATDLKP